MLVTKEVEISISYNNYEYYQNLGYSIETFINKRGNLSARRSKFKINVEDLPKNSRAKVLLCCDYCNRNYTTTYEKYCNHNHDGKTYCIHCAKKVLESGENSPKWNHTLTDEEREYGRRYSEYLTFVRNVLARDKSICFCCGKEHKDAEVHHLNGYNWYIEGRVDELNAVTLCPKCHANFHLLYGKGNNTKEQFEEWIGFTISNLKKFNGELPTARKVYCIDQDKIYHSAIQVQHILHINKTSIYAICNKRGRIKSANGLHFLWLDEYEKMTDEEVIDYLEKCKSTHNRKIICVTTNKIFEKITDGAREYGISPSNVRHAIVNDNGQKYAGKLDDGTPLEWMYYEDWENYQQAV